MKVAIYGRVSTEEQTTDHQVSSLLDFCKNRQYEVYKIYKDVISGAKDSRPELNQMMQDAYNRHFESIIIWKLDRLGRSLQHLLDITNKLERWNIGLICQTQPFDTTSPGGKLIFQIFGAMAEFERNLISERTKLGLKRAKNVGKRGKDKRARKKGGYYLRYQKKGGISNNVI